MRISKNKGSSRFKAKEAITREFLHTNYTVKKLSAKEVGALISTSPTTILRQLRLYGIEVRGRGKALRYDINEDYFKSINTYEKAYILGYILGDGYVSCSKGSCFLSLHVSVDDLEPLQFIRDALGYPDDIIKYHKSTHPSWKDTISLRVYRKTIYNDLIAAGIVKGPHTNKEKFFELGTPELTWSLLRGLSDADGSIVLGNSRGSSACCWSLSVSREYLNNMRDFMIREGIDLSAIAVLRVSGTGRFSVAAKKSVLAIRDKMYANGELAMTRKKDKFFSI